MLACFYACTYRLSGEIWWLKPVGGSLHLAFTHTLMAKTGKHSCCHLGAPPPEITLKSLNAGLTNDHVNIGNPFAYVFTEALVLDLRDFFLQQKAHGLFLCEMGSQKPLQDIDRTFKARCAAYADGQLQAPQGKEAWAFCDRSASLYEYISSWPCKQPS